MKILNIKIKNLNSLKLETEINFEESPFREVGLFAIVGDTGAGKTTILDAITLALYGKIHRNKEVKEVISYGAGDCYAEVIFEVQGERYLSQWSIWRARGKADGNILGPNRKLSIWNSEENEFRGIAEKIREVDEKIEAITGLDYDRFTRSLMLSQGDFAAFLKAGEKERSDLLERITGTEIYSEISKSAFLKHKSEVEKLSLMKQELDSLKLLDREELKILKADLKEKETIGKDQKLELDNVRKGILWWKDLGKLRQNFEKNETNLIKIGEQEKLLELDLSKLELHKKTIPFQQKLIRYDDKLLEINLIEKEVLRLETLKSNLEKEEIEKQSKYKEKENSFKSIKASQKEFLALIEKVIKLDIGIEEKILPLKGKKNNFELLKNKLKKSQKKLHDLKQNQTTAETNFLKAKTWTKENVHLQKLPEEYETIRHLFFEIEGIISEGKSLKIELEEVNADLKNVKKEEVDLAERLKELQRNLLDLETTFKEVLPENYTLERSEVLANLNQEIEQMAEISAHLEHWRRQQEAYQKLIKELAKYNEDLENLQNQVANLDNEVMSALDIRGEAKRELEFKTAVWEQQMMIKNYEKDRAKLEVDAACPLCLSTDHPFRKKNLKPFVDAAKKEYDAAKKFFEKWEKAFRNLMTQQQELTVKISELRGNEVKQISGRLGKQESEVMELEQQFSTLMVKLKGHDLTALKTDEVVTKSADFLKEIAEKKKIRTTLLKLDTDLNSTEKALNSLKEKWQKAEILVKQKTEEEKYKSKKFKELQGGFKLKEKALIEILAKYQIEFEAKKREDIFKILEEKKKLILENADKLLRFEKQLNVLEKEIELEHSKIEEFEKDFEKLEKEIQVEIGKIEKLKNQRAELFGEKNPQKEREIFNENLEGKERELSILKISLDELVLKLKTTINSLKEKESQKNKDEKLILELKNDLEKMLPESGFKDLGTVKLAILPLETVEKIETEKANLNLKKEVLNTEKLKLKTALAETEIQKTEFKPLLDLEKSLPVLEESYQNLQQEIGKIKGQLSDNKTRQQESKELLQSIDKQRVEVNRWGALNDLIGSADGKKFRVFAQGLTLKNLVILANRHLQNLNGRYLILKPDDQDLKLNIMDTFQADNTRSMNTLSGGESFLVSLALALGLSDLAGRNTNIRSLFIDEGFGTLDENSLDLALTTLENLQASGKTIGVISHVKALKERIATQIFIQKKGSGFSEIEVVF